MKTMHIRLSTISEVRDFVDTVAKYDGDIDLESGRYVVDGKSIMGIFSLDLLSPIKVIAYTEDADKLFADLAKFKA